MEISFFNVVVDAAFALLQKRLKAMGEVERKFSLLVSFSNQPSEELTKQCEISATR